MQPDHAHPHHESPSLPDSSAPSLPSLHRHHQPTATAEPYPEAGASGSGLRRRTVSPNGDTILLEVRTPFDDASSSSRRREPAVVPRGTTVSALKDEIALGTYGPEGERWVREGLRLVWQGRIIRDEEILRDVVAASRDPNQVHIFHLVARRLGRPALSTRVSSTIIPPALTPAPSSFPPAPAAAPAAPPTETHSPLNASSPESQALYDCIHYLLFASRHHLFHLLGRRLLAWDEMVPPPVVGREIARQAVASLLGAIVDAAPVDDRAGLAGWQVVLDDLDRSGMVKVWSEMGGRDKAESIVADLWKNRVGRSWREEGEVVQIEVDSNICDLHLPPLHLLSPSQLVHLVQYLRIASLLPHLYTLLAHLHPPPPTSPPATLAPTPTFTIPLAPAPARRAPTALDALAILSPSVPRIPLPVLSHMFFSAIKLVAMLWMLTQGMPWSDTRLWIIGGAATGWWLGDGWHRYNREMRQIRAAEVAAARQAALANPPLQEDQPGAPEVPLPDQAQGQQGARDGAVVQANIAVDAPMHARAAAAAAAAAIPPNSAATPARTSAHHPLFMLPLVHIATDAHQLRLPVDRVNPNNPNNRPANPAPARRPPWIVTQLILPICLWFITLIPEFESMRARAIRQRETTIRVMVGELNAPADAPNATEGVDGEVQPPRESILPESLNEVARKYYLRVMERGEGIDWEEEREAQRAMGVGEEEEQGGLIGIF